MVLVLAAFVASTIAAVTGTGGGVILLPVLVASLGALLSPVIIAGSYLGKRTVDRIPERIFVGVVETALVVFGVLFLVTL